MYPGDARSRWPAALLTDRRVSHYWDEPRVLGELYMNQLPAILDRRAPATLSPSADAMWDAFFVYAPGDSWQDPLPMPRVWGYPIMVTRDQLVRELQAVASSPNPILR